MAEERRLLPRLAGQNQRPLDALWLRKIGTAAKFYCQILGSSAITSTSAQSGTREGRREELLFVTLVHVTRPQLPPAKR